MVTIMVDIGFVVMAQYIAIDITWIMIIQLMQCDHYDIFDITGDRLMLNLVSTLVISTIIIHLTSISSRGNYNKR